MEFLKVSLEEVFTEKNLGKISERIYKRIKEGISQKSLEKIQVDENTNEKVCREIHQGICGKF